MSNFTPSRFTRPMRGFSLLELMITIVIAGVLLALALPSLRGTGLNSTVTGLNNRLLYSLNFARSEAVRRGTQVEVLAANGDASWSQGWSVIADTDFSSTFTGTDTTIAVEAAIPVTYTVCGNATGGGANSAVVFSPAGIMIGPTSFDMNINRPDANRPLSRRISVQGSGSITTRSNTTGSPAPISC